MKNQNSPHILERSMRQLCIASALLLMLVLFAVPKPSFAQGSADASSEQDDLAIKAQQANQYRSTVVRVYVTDHEEIGQLANKYDVWEEAISSQPYVTILASERDREELTELGYRVEVDQPQSASIMSFEEWSSHEDSVRSAEVRQAIDGFACYRTVEETYSSLSQLAANNPTLATWTDVGNSYDKQTAGGDPGYDVNVLKLTNNTIPGPKPALMVISAIHAREYTTAEMNSRFAEYLVNNYGTNADATWLLDHHEIHILPQANPDGRKEAERGLYWRKNKNPTNGCAGGNSYGVDLNRNSSFQWGGFGSSNNTCSQTYRGPSPKSEPEVQAIQDYATALFADQRGPGLNDPAPADTEGVFITIHSYSELILFPWGWSTSPGPNQDGLATLGRKFGYYTGYQVCNPGACLYIADGTTDDWAYGELGVASYTFELGTSFFQDCATFENTIYPDNLSALIYAAKAARRPYQTPSGPEATNLSVSQDSVSAGTAVTLNAQLDDTRHDSNGPGTEPRQSIQAARYTIDTPSWKGGQIYSMNASDGLFNSTAENVTAQIDTASLANGKHTIFVEGQDADGTWGVPTAIFLEIADASITQGDVNCDGEISAVDALFILQYSVQLRTDVGTCPLADSTTELNASLGDVNGDENLDVVDALFVLQCTVGLTNPFCPQ